MILDTIIQFFLVLKDYLVEIIPFLALGFFLSGIINEFVPEDFVTKHLGGGGPKPLLYATLVGTALPICCLGSLPVAISLHQKGARMGPVLAFLIAAPATSVSALLVAYALLGVKFTVYIFFAVIVMALAAGLIGNRLRVKPRMITSSDSLATDPVCGCNVSREGSLRTEHRGISYYFCGTHCQQDFARDPAAYTTGAPRTFRHRAKHVLRYAFVDMVKEIAPEISISLVLAALIVVLTPVGNFIGTYFQGVYGYLFSLVFGTFMAICATASLPLAEALISQGMNTGAVMTLMLIGPITSFGTILIIRKEFGWRTLTVYFLVISISALALGYLFSLI
ncbi:MAG: permease [Chloroflexota bacterium]